MRAGSISMHSAEEYRKFAEECERLAREAKAEHHRNILREMAATWKKLAEEADRKARF